LVCISAEGTLFLSSTISLTTTSSVSSLSITVESFESASSLADSSSSCFCFLISSSFFAFSSASWIVKHDILVRFSLVNSLLSQETYNCYNDISELAHLKHEEFF
jgi:hypothetical protein